MWKHFQPHKFENYTNLEKEMLKNKGFAQVNDKDEIKCIMGSLDQYYNIDQNF